MIKLFYKTIQKNSMKKTKAFTLIETLIVIVIFCIGILAVLYWLSQTLRNKEYANTQIQSAFFAREWIELVFNLRDANYHKELPWNCIPQLWISNDWEWCTKNLEPWMVLKIEIWDWDDYINVEVDDEKNIWDIEKDDDFDNIFENYQIYKHLDNDTFLYNHTKGDGEETWYARYIIIKPFNPAEWKIKDIKLLKIESHVLYKKWIFKWEKLMETFIWNYEFNQ